MTKTMSMNYGMRMCDGGSDADIERYDDLIIFDRCSAKQKRRNRIRLKKARKKYRQAGDFMSA